MKLIDALAIKIRQFLSTDVLSPLAAARTQYGSREDYRTLAMQLTETLANSADQIIVDLSPFDRIGNKSAFGEFLLSRPDLDRILFLAGSDDLLELLYARRRADENLSFVAIDDRACIADAAGPAYLQGADLLRDFVMEHKPLADLRRLLAGERILAWIRDTLITAGSGAVCEADIALLDGRKFIRMQTGMVVSGYVNMKAILSVPDRLIELAVEVCWQLFDGFRRDGSKTVPQWIVVPNNTSLQLGAAIQAISEVPIAIIDHIGPVPAFGVAQKVSAELRGSEVTVLTDVSATGGEIDRSILFLHGLGARIREVICPVWLEVGRCQLMSGIKFIPLCTPKRELAYEYRSE